MTIKQFKALCEDLKWMEAYQPGPVTIGQLQQFIRDGIVDLKKYEEVR